MFVVWCVFYKVNGKLFQNVSFVFRERRNEGKACPRLYSAPRIPPYPPPTPDPFTPSLKPVLTDKGDVSDATENGRKN